MRLGFTVTLLLLLLAASCTRDDLTTTQVSESELDDYTSAVFGSADFLRHADALQEMEDREAMELAELAGHGQNTIAPSGEPFIFFVIGDSELLMRGNTYPQLENWIDHINDIESFGLEFTSGDFEEGESRAITKPAIVLLAGDICKDRAFGFSLPGDENYIARRETYRLFNQLDEDILFLAGNGNHDWDPYQWGDGDYGHNFGGLLSNLGTAQFVRSSYFKSLNNTDEIQGNSFNYDRNVSWFRPTTSAEFNYSVVYRGVRFTQLNQFLFQPAAMVSFESIFGTGPAWYFETRAGQWFQGLCDASAENSIPHVVVQHFPVNTGDNWWNDDLGGGPDALRKRFMDIFEDSHQPVMFSGHNHSRRKTMVEPYGIIDYTSGYFAEGHITAVKASAAKGVYAVSFIRLSDLATADPSTATSTYTIPQ
jgi:hypothetical protein